MNIGLSDRIRAFAKAKYVNPAVRSGKTQFSIRVRDVVNELKPEGFPQHNTPQVCNALTGRKFLRENGIEIDKVEGPPSGQGPRVVVYYRVGSSNASAVKQLEQSTENSEVPIETRSERAFRLTEKLRGILKEELAEYGGGEAFIRWVRSDDEEAA